MKEMVIGFVTLGLEFDGSTLSTQGLGGSETALICMAREMAKRGHRVSVFCNTTNPGTYDGVTYYSHKHFQKICAVTPWDVLVASRWPEFLTVPSQAGLRVLWLHDMPTDQARIMGQVWQTDQILLLSDFHVKSYTESDVPGEDATKRKMPWLLPFISKTSNGVDSAQIAANLRPKVPYKLIYTSRPERGLHYLLQNVMPTLVKEFPEVKLHYCNYSLQNMQLPDNVKQAIQISEILAKQYPDNVVNMGHLTKDRLYQEISSSQLLLYPTEFPEISCITAMEAQACGTPIVSTNDFALKETVCNRKTGFLIDGKPSDGEIYFAKFLRKVRLLLNDSTTYNRMSAAGPEWIKRQGYTWDSVAESWEGLFGNLLEERYQNNKVKIAFELERNSDLLRAAEVLREAKQDGEDVSVALARVEDDTCDVVDRAPSPKTGEEVVSQFKTDMARFRKMAEFMLVKGCDPKTVWDFACGDSAFALFMAKASPKCTAYAIDEDEEVLQRVSAYAAQSELTNVLTKRASSTVDVTASEPDFLFLGNILDTVANPWLFLEDAAKRVKPGGFIGLTTRYGPSTVGLPDEHKRIWNFSQDDYFQMFGKEFTGHLAFNERGFSDGGDLYGDWLVLIPITDQPFTVRPPSANKVKMVTRPYVSLAACVIAKDCEDWVFKFAKPVLKVVDKLYVTLDTRTADRSAQLFKMLQPYDKVELRWNEFDNFGAQRNFSKQDVDEDWIFWLDTDEVLVGGMKLRRYLQGPILEGFSIRQNHLMLDVHGTFDVPIRIFRNRPEYNFVGCIHEHCEDTGRGGFDNPIRPASLLPDVDLAHYGYLNESQRRDKCSNRNMELLIRDLKENPERKLNKVLAIRDYLNIVKWKMDRDQTRRIRAGSESHRLIEAAVSTFHQFLSNPTLVHHKLAFPMYQEALSILGINQLPYGDRATAPFCVALGLAGAIGGPASEDVKAKRVWFVDQTEFQEFMAQQEQVMLQKLGFVDEQTLKKDLDKPSGIQHNYGEDLPDLLTAGAGVIDQTTGQLQ